MWAVRQTWGLAVVLLGSGCLRESSSPPPREPAPASRARQERPHTAAPARALPPARTEANSPPGASPEKPATSTELGARFGGAAPLVTLQGEASYYGNSLAGHRTASGERYDPALATAAHKTLPLGTILRVTRADDGRVTYVRVNDRGPYARARRILDLSYAAAQDLDMLRRGVVNVRVDVLAYGPARRR
jgi:rare lipoprotein A